jgi:hypothetical protein
MEADKTGPERYPMADFFERGNALSGCIKFRDELSGYRIFNDSALLNYFTDQQVSQTKFISIIEKTVLNRLVIKNKKQF